MDNLTPAKRRKLERLAKVVDEGNVGIFEYISELEDKIDELLPSVKEIIARTKGDPGDNGDDGHTPTDEELLTLIRPLIPEVEHGHTPTDKELLALIRPLIPQVKDGHTPTRGELLTLIEPLIPSLFELTQETIGKLTPLIPKLEDFEKNLPKLGESIRDGLEKLKEDDRLDKTAIKGLDTLEERVAKVELRPVTSGGRTLLQLYVNGSKKGAIQYLNLIPGSNVTMAYAYASGRNDITISATGGGSGAFSILTVTGTIDDSNLSFTVASQPTLVIINGASYRTTGDSITWTYVAGTLTLSQAVGTGGSIYALG